jgi:hypothetical protein
MRFAQLCSREDLERLCAAVLPRGEGLSWSHVRCLLQIEDRTQRETLLEKVVEDGLTCSELAYEVKQLHDADNRGRPPKVPADFDGMLTQQRQFVDQWDRRFTKTWTDAKRSLFTKAAALKPEEVTEEKVKQTRELAHTLRSLKKEVGFAVDKLEAIAKGLQEKLEQPQGTEESQAGPEQEPDEGEQEAPAQVEKKVVKGRRGGRTKKGSDKPAKD